MATQRSATGYSGQAAVMAELLARRCNVALPFIDEGLDLFAFQYDREGIARIQVKSCQGTPYKKEPGYRAQFNIPRKQLDATDEPELSYAMPVRLADRWASFLVISRNRLKRFTAEESPFGIEIASSDEIALKIQYRLDPLDPERLTARCGSVDLTDFLDAWHLLPSLQPQAE